MVTMKCNTFSMISNDIFYSKRNLQGIWNNEEQTTSLIFQIFPALFFLLH